MATKNITRTILKLNEVTKIPLTSVTSADDVYFDYNGGGDEKLVILANGNVTLTLKKGNMIQGVTDVVGSVTTSGAIRIDSGLFKAAKSDTDTKAVKGKVYLKTSGAATVALIQLP